MRISDWSSDVCSSDLVGTVEPVAERATGGAGRSWWRDVRVPPRPRWRAGARRGPGERFRIRRLGQRPGRGAHRRSEEHTSELQSLMRNTYAVFCLKKKISTNQQNMSRLVPNHESYI